MKEWTKLLLITLIFLAAYYIPWGNSTIRKSSLEAFIMLQEYAREHVLTCFIPAFFIAGAIAMFVSQASVLRYFPSKEEITSASFLEGCQRGFHVEKRRKKEWKSKC